MIHHSSIVQIYLFPYLLHSVSQNLIKLHITGPAVLVNLVIRNVTDLHQQVSLAFFVEAPQLSPVDTLVEDELKSKGFQGGIGYHVFCRVGVMAGRRVDDIEGETEGLVEHLWDDATEKGTG